MYLYIWKEENLILISILGNKLVLASPIIFHFFSLIHSLKTVELFFFCLVSMNLHYIFNFCLHTQKWKIFIFNPRPLHAKWKLIMGKKCGNGQSQFLMFSTVKEKILHKESKWHLGIQGHGKVPKNPDFKQLSESYSAKLQGTHWICGKEEKHSSLWYSLCEAILFLSHNGISACVNSLCQWRILVWYRNYLKLSYFRKHVLASEWQENISKTNVKMLL